MVPQCLNRNWQFQLGSKDAAWQTVQLPHDYSILQPRAPEARTLSSGGFFPGGNAIYRKTLYVPSAWRDKRIVLEFEGVYMNAEVRVNDHFACLHPYGYTSFHCDISGLVHYGVDNVITVSVANDAAPNSRWYSGSGIYRPVWLMVGEPLHIQPWGVYVTTPDVAADAARVHVATELKNSGDMLYAATLETSVLNGQGRVVAQSQTAAAVDVGACITVEQDLQVASPALWSVDDPALYTLHSQVVYDGRVVDEARTTFGIRSLCFSFTDGFRLNGQSIKLKGGCVHHDCGLVGAAAYARAEERKVELLKKSGYNAIRTAHNPPSPAMLEACDRLGMLVLDEAFDCWRDGKNPYDYHAVFATWWKEDLASMVRRDRNHPCVILWSTGNEILERDGHSDGYRLARELADAVRALDPTRPVTNAVCGLWRDDPDDDWAKLTAPFIEPLDVVGYNYLWQRYEADAQRFPGRIIMGTESFPMEAFDNWDIIGRMDNVIGDFVWTSWDYFGEAGIGMTVDQLEQPVEKYELGAYPWHQAFCGDLDICGFKRPQSYYRDVLWGVRQEPYIAVHRPLAEGYHRWLSRWAWPDVQASWNWPGYEGQPLQVDVYAAGDEVELLLCGRSLGRVPCGAPQRYTASFSVPYEAGELLAIRYVDGQEAGRQALATAGAPTQIVLTPDRTELSSAFGDLSYITVELQDAAGRRVPTAEDEVTFHVSGAGESLAVGNGNPVSTEMYVGNRRKAFQGRAMLVVRTTGLAGPITVSAMAEGLPLTQVTLQAKERK